MKDKNMLECMSSARLKPKTVFPARLNSIAGFSELNVLYLLIIQQMMKLKLHLCIYVLNKDLQ